MPGAAGMECPINLCMSKLSLIPVTIFAINKLKRMYNL